MSGDEAHVNAPRVAISLRPLANPLPLGLFSFAIGMVVLAGQTARWIPAGEDAQVGILMAAFVFPLEGTAAVFAFLVRDTVAATVLGLFATSWLALGLLGLSAPPGARSPAAAFLLFGFAAVVYTLCLLAMLGKPLIGAILALSGTRAALDGIYQLAGGSELERVAGYLAAAIAATAIYAGAAIVLEDLRQEEVLPVFRRGAGRRAMSEEPAQEIEHVGHEAGIRRQL